MSTAPFALLVEFLPVRDPWGRAKTYRAKMQIKLRDAEVLQLIDRHGLRDVVIHTDGVVEATGKQQGETVQALETSVAGWDVATLLRSMWTYGRLSLKATCAVEITLGRLLHVVEIEGRTSDEISFVVAEVRGQIDRLAAKLATAESFEGGGEVRVYLPGEKVKPVKNKSGSPPSSWGG
jgi:hypothetical protein